MALLVCLRTLPVHLPTSPEALVRQQVVGAAGRGPAAVAASEVCCSLYSPWQGRVCQEMTKQSSTGFNLAILSGLDAAVGCTVLCTVLGQSVSCIQRIICIQGVFN